MATHFLDIRGKIKDAEAILAEYQKALSDAIRSGDDDARKRYELMIERQSNYIDGLRERLTFGDV